MKSNKILHIKECFFELPDDFNGSLGDALLLMANRAIQAEVYKEVSNKIVYDMRDYFINKRKGKAAISYEIIEVTT